MGCATSKQPVCRNCQKPCNSPMTRSYSMHVHHPPQRDGDTYHLVALTSTTLGYLELDPSNSSHVNKNPDVVQFRQETVRQNAPEKKKADFAVEVIEAKTCSKMIEEKIPKFAPRTPIRTPPGEPETINAWELMEGLDDTSPLRSPPNHLRGFSFDVNPNTITHESESKENSENESDTNSNSRETSVASDFDPEVMTAFRKSLEELPAANPFHLKPLGNDKKPALEKEKLVLYLTSLRGIRKTYEDCCDVKSILKGTGVRVDERDVSMHSGFKEELKERVGDGYRGGGLPKVFIGKKLMGGADEIRRLHEDGELERALEGCEMVDGAGGCEACGDVRFLPCETCSGSCKIYHGEDEFGFQRCPDCNENGLVRCSVCCH